MRRMLLTAVLLLPVQAAAQVPDVIGISLSAAPSALAKRIAQAAWDGPDNLEKSESGGRTVWKLYGTTINDASTSYGRLACARVVSAILRAARAGVPASDGVGGIESSLRRARWEKIESFTALQPGDVIVWKRRFSDDACSGGGDCHIGIYWGSGLSYDNDGKLGYPIRYPVAPRVAFSFKAAYRAR